MELDGAGSTAAEERSRCRTGRGSWRQTEEGGQCTRAAKQRDVPLPSCLTCPAGVLMSASCAACESCGQDRGIGVSPVRHTQPSGWPDGRRSRVSVFQEPTLRDDRIQRAASGVSHSPSSPRLNVPSAAGSGGSARVRLARGRQQPQRDEASPAQHDNAITVW